MSTHTKAPSQPTPWGARIATARRERQLNQTQLAAKCGLTKAAISQYETGRVRKIISVHLFAIAKALRVHASWIETGKGAKEAEGAEHPALDEAELRLILSLRDALPAYRDYVIRLGTVNSHTNQKMFLAVFGAHVPDERVAEAYGKPGV